MAVYDLGAEQRVGDGGLDHDTASFAVESVRRWWARDGPADSIRRREHVLICADERGQQRLSAPAVEGGTCNAGGCDWLANVTVCHYAAGTSKWNKIEHRLFAHITKNWRGKPLVSHEVVVKLIGAPPPGKGCRYGRNATQTRTRRGSTCPTRNGRRSRSHETRFMASGTTPLFRARRTLICKVYSVEGPKLVVGMQSARSPQAASSHALKRNENHRHDFHFF